MNRQTQKLHRAVEESMGNPEIRNGASVLHCPRCGAVIHWTNADDRRFPEVIAHESEVACELHLRTYHRRRYRLWQLTGWEWPLRGLRL